MQHDEIKEGVYTVQEIIDFLEAEGDSFFSVKANVGWSQSTLNRGVFPDRGYSQSLSLETTVPGSDMYFYKLGYRGQRFFPLTRDLTLRVHTDSGILRRFGSTDRVPFFEHYYAGGIGSVRGFESSTLGPKSTPNPLDPDQDPLPFGGNVKITGGAELIFPVPFVQDQRSMRTVVFLDAGNVFDTYCGDCPDVSASEIRYSVGVGLSWLTALGPLGFSLGMPLNDESDDDRQVFQFTLGQTF